ncbi:hypothetical protein A9Q93_12195 [Nonlabens dokdonensis]|uniref:Uncharacterized protein n=1 Tax=Nonlabens dokdonensis TaxID=328515 RepID=A0A1Z8AKZ9_9FLAO|nr:hypothetical protein [Nonlabens dokdonensis]OUS11000.1 hypothetical protein A9Q93_12195 [Nonlabens dokdonensis]
MPIINVEPRTRAQESTNAIERMYITMRHLFNRGFYKPMGVSGESLRESLLTLRPEIYGSISEEKIELSGLLYVMDRLPVGIEECTYINLTSDEGYEGSHFKAIIPKKRRRNCYRIDSQQMNIEVTRGRSEIYDILTHLTFLMIESHKIMKQVMVGDNGNTTRDWKCLEDAISKKKLSQEEKEVAITHVANILGRTFDEVKSVYADFATASNPNRFLSVIYHLGRLARQEVLDEEKRLVTFSPVLRERLGHHIHGDIWAMRIKKHLVEQGLFDRPLHIISANLHSVMNSLYGPKALASQMQKKSRMEIFADLSNDSGKKNRDLIKKHALANGMTELKDQSGTNIDVQIFDLSNCEFEKVDFCDIRFRESENSTKPVLIVMDYAFGEQAYETMDELLKPFKDEVGKMHQMNVQSINIMGKAGILEGDKGDIMVPDAHVFEGTADNYPFKNRLSKKDLESDDIKVVTGSMVTVLGTSLQNKDLLEFFYNSSWNVIGLEMEGAHYQKAIQAASRVRRSIRRKVKVRYAYYASDNPLKTGHTLASGGLGLIGVKPVYVITEKILEQIMENSISTPEETSVTTDS